MLDNEWRMAHREGRADEKAARGTCKTCKHWQLGKEPDSDRIISPEDPDTFEPMKDLPFEVRKCENPRVLFCERPVERQGAAVMDGSNYFACLYGAEDFGCVLHERKAAE